MVKYKEYVKKMLDENKEAFAAFRKLHDAYANDTKGLQREYNEAGSKIQDIVREYDDRLCRNTERGQYSTFSGGLSEKFHAEVKKIFPMIEHIGLVPQEAVQAPPPSQSPAFAIKRISL
jgi:hypothetical protein